MKSKNYISYFVRSLIILSLFNIGCDKRHSLSPKESDPNAKLIIDSNSNPDTSSSRDITLNLNSNSEISPTSIASTTDGNEITLSNGLKFLIPKSPVVIRCGSLINKNIASSTCTVNNYTGASQPLGMIMEMQNSYGTTGPACPTLCMCTGESLEMSGWNCKSLPTNESYTPIIQGCGSKINIFNQGTDTETICIVNRGAGVAPLNTTKVMELYKGTQSVCDQTSCTCTSDETLNRKYAGWKCTQNSTSTP